MQRLLKILIEDVINKIILCKSLNYTVYFKFLKNKGALLSVFDSNKIIWIYPYDCIFTESHTRKILMSYFGESIIRK